MYYYVYDSFTQGKEFQKVLTRLETEINNLGLSGERGQVTALRKVEDLVKEAARKKYHPIVVVGDDATFNAALNALAEMRSDTPLGYLPLREQSMSRLLGLDSGNAVVSLSRRIIRKLPLARAGKAYFLSHVRCQQVEPEQPKGLLQRLMQKKPKNFEANFAIDKKIMASVLATHFMVHYDPKKRALRVETQGDTPKDRRRGSRNNESIIWGNTIQLGGQPPLTCLIDGRPVTRSPLTVEITDQRIPVIVGRSRNFA